MKSNNNSMIGKWEGFYIYDKKWIQELIGHEKTNFEATILKEDNNGNYWGKIEDDLKTGGTPGIGEIEGSKDNISISFIKKMPLML